LPLVGIVGQPQLLPFSTPQPLLSSTTSKNNTSKDLVAMHLMFFVLKRIYRPDYFNFIPAKAAATGYRRHAAAPARRLHQK
jgi:hypothetical protein